MSFTSTARSGVRTNPPYNLSISNAPLGNVALHAIVYDDDGASASSPTVNVQMALRVDSVWRTSTAFETNLVVLEFGTPPNQPLNLEFADSLSPTEWTSVNSRPFPAGQTYIITNSIPSNTPIRLYRLRTP